MDGCKAVIRQVAQRGDLKVALHDDGAVEVRRSTLEAVMLTEDEARWMALLALPAALTQQPE